MCMLPRGRVLVREFHEAPRGKILHSTRLLLLITGRDEAKREKYESKTKTISIDPVFLSSVLAHATLYICTTYTWKWRIECYT